MAETSPSQDALSEPRRQLGPDALEGAGTVLKDVWSRSGSKYRIRAVVLLAVNVLLFAGVGSFAFWLRSGVRFAPVHDGYWDELKQTFWSSPIIGDAESNVSLGSLLVEPVGVQDVPMQIPILGLLMAALISIPILAAMLYRFWSSLPFIAVVGFLAVMPWLAITLLGSCIIASARPLRTRFRFMSALLALLPAVASLIFAWYGTADAVAGRIEPVDRIKFIAPWVLAIVAATLVFAIVLAIARLVDYRPGAIAPLLAVMFGLPVALFEFRVGRDELYYRLLESLNEAHFADIDTSVELDEAVMDAWLRRPPPRRSIKAVRETVETRWLFELAAEIEPIQSALTRHQAELVQRCDRFLKYFPHSRYAPNALFIKARALDMRVDPAEFRRTKWIRFYDDFPSAASRVPWRMIVENRPDTILSAYGLWRLAQLDAREGNVGRAITRLRTLFARSREYAENESAASASDGLLKGVLARETPESSLRIPAERIFLEAHRLHDLLVENRDPLYGYDPVAGPRHQPGTYPFGLMDLDPRHDRFVENLETLKHRYPNCQIEDNIDLEIAKVTASPALKVERLAACLEKFPRRDAVPEALFRLGVAYRLENRSQASEDVFMRLLHDFPDSIWTKQAARYTQWRGGVYRSSATAEEKDRGKG